MRLSLAIMCLVALAACAPRVVAPVAVPLPASSAVGQGPSPVSGRLVGSTMVEPEVGAPGRWVALADIGRPVQGWITDQETGMSAQVELRPRTEGEIDRISLGALQALGIGTARLVVIDVHYDLSSL